MVGHFPVFFKGNDENSFVVDKTKQSEAMLKVKTYAVLLCSGLERTYMRKLSCAYDR